MALPAVYEARIKPLGLEFHSVRPDIDPNNSLLVEMIYDVNHGTETGLREFLFPALRQTYDDLLDAATKPVRADLLLLGELNYAGPLVAEVTGIPWASYVLAPLSFFSAFDPPVLPPYPRLAKADKAVPGFGRVIKRVARFVSRKWPQPIYDLRRELGLTEGANPLFDAKHSPYLVLALFSRVLGVEQKDWPEHTLITGFCFYDADAGNAALPRKAGEVSGRRALRRWCLLWDRRRCLRQETFTSNRRKVAMRLGVASRASDWDGPAEPSEGRAAGLDLRGGVCALLGVVSAGGAGGAPGRSGDDGAMPARGEADADYALLARPAGQRAADAAAGSGQGDQEGELHAGEGGAEAGGDVCGAEVPAERAAKVAEQLKHEDGVETACNALERLYAETRKRVEV